MRLPFAFIGSAAVLSCAAAANADFTGWQYTVSQSGGFTIMNVYAGFSNTGDRVVNVFNADITTNAAGGFYQSAGSPFWQATTGQNANSVDSFVCIGTNPNGNGNVSGSITAGDPNFLNYNDGSGTTTYDFSVIESAGTGAGWYNNNPSNAWGFANQGNSRVLVAHFVFAPQEGALVVNWSATMTIKKDGQTGSETAGTGNFQFFIPAPGALALLGVAGLASRRRRA